MVSFSCVSTKAVKFPENELAPIIADKANEYFIKKDYKTAIACYQIIIDRFDKTMYAKEVAWANYEIGYCYYYKKDYKNAIKYFDIVLKDFTIVAPRILAGIVLEDIYIAKPNLRPRQYYEE